MSNRRKISETRRANPYAGMHVTEDHEGWIEDGEPTLAALLTGPGGPGILHDLCDGCVEFLERGGYIGRIDGGRHFEVIRTDGLERLCLGQDTAELS